MASSTEPSRIDYPVFHLNTCSLPFTGFLACMHARVSFTWQSVHVRACLIHAQKFHFDARGKIILVKLFREDHVCRNED